MNRTLPERIFLCGFMGAGKSTVGQALAKKLDSPFHDLDTYIEQQHGQSIASIFREEGEQAFRSKERSALIDLIDDKKGVVALGGGTLHNQHLVDHVKVNGLLALIYTPIETIIERIADDTDRPMLLDENGKMKSKAELKQELSFLFEQRKPFYEQAEVTINSTEYKTVDDLVKQLVKKIRYHVALH